MEISQRENELRTNYLKDNGLPQDTVLRSLDDWVWRTAEAQKYEKHSYVWAGSGLVSFVATVGMTISEFGNNIAIGIEKALNLSDMTPTPGLLPIAATFIAACYTFWMAYVANNQAGDHRANAQGYLKPLGRQVEEAKRAIQIQ